MEVVTRNVEYCVIDPAARLRTQSLRTSILQGTVVGGLALTGIMVAIPSP